VRFCPYFATQTANSVTLSNTSNLAVFVDCTSTFCLVPVDDIANAVVQQFVPAFQSGLVTIINQGAADYVDTFAVTVHRFHFALSSSLRSL
jgi:hypothetical protein